MNSPSEGGNPQADRRSVGVPAMLVATGFLLVALTRRNHHGISVRGCVRDRAARGKALSTLVTQSYFL